MVDRLNAGVKSRKGAVKWMRAQPNHNGKVHLFGSCSDGIADLL